MKFIPLSKGKFAIVDDADFETVSQYKWTYSKMKSGNEYALRRFYKEDGKVTTQLLHRFILGDAVDGMLTDHKDGNGLNNQRDNLRICNHTQNQTNKRPKRKSAKSSAYKGVYWYESRQNYVSQIRVDGKHIFLGRFSTELEAALAYDKASIRYHGEFANNNNLIKP